MKRMNVNCICGKNSSVVEDFIDPNNAVRMDLYMKSGPNGTVGDCPFAHFVRMVLHTKELKYNLHPCTQEQKPDWLINEFEGKMPCLDDNGEKRVESSVIAEFIDEKYPDPPLRKAFDEAKMVDAQNATSSLFPSLAKFLKNKDFDYYAEKAFITALKGFEQYLKDSGYADNGKYLLGDKISMLDCSLTPKLYIVDVAVKHFFPDSHTKVRDMELVNKYMKFMFDTDVFKQTQYPAETMIHGWEQARGATQASCGM